jgi:two-component system sensor histidine kinase VicK
MDYLNESLFQAVFNTPVARLILKADTPNFTIVAYNDAYKQATHTQDRIITGLSLWEAYNPANAGDDGAEILREALTGATENNQTVCLPPFQYDIPSADLVKMEANWWEMEIEPIGNKDSKPEFLLITTYNITDRVLRRQIVDEAKQREQNLSEELAAINEELTTTNEELFKSQESLVQLNTQLEKRVEQRTKSLAESEARFRNMVEQSSVAMLVTRGREMIFEVINQPMLTLIGRTLAEVKGKTWFEAMPELKGQPIIEQLLQCYDTAKEWRGIEQPILIYKNNEPTQGYYNISYKPLIEDGQVVGVLQSALDITEQVVARKQVEASEHRLNTMVKTTPIGMTIFHGRDFIIEIANQHMLEIWNHSEHEVIGLPLLAVFPELADQPFPKLLENVFDTGKAITIPEMEADIISPHGNRHIYIDFSYDPLFDTDGKVESILVTVINITETVEARKLLEQSEAEQQALNEELSSINEEMAAANEELVTTNEDLAQTQQTLVDMVNKLTESEGRFRILVQEAPVAIAVLKGRGLTIESANDLILKIWGKTAAITGQQLAEAMPELKEQPFLQLLDAVYISGKPYFGYEAKVALEHEGQLEEIYCDFIYQPLTDNDTGESTHIMVVAVDVTEQVATKRELQRAEAMLRFSIEAANVGTWSLNVNTREFISSTRLKEIYGFKADERITTEDAIAQIPEEYRDKVAQGIETSIAANVPFNIEHPVVGHHDKKQRWVKALGRLYPDSDGNLTHFSGLAMEITEQKLDELRKNDFIGMVSHELKTPLTSLSAIVQMLNNKAKRNEDTFTGGALDKAYTQVKKMTSMINGFLNISRLESGKILLEKQVFELGELINDIIEETLLTATGYTINFLPCDHVIIYADKDKMGSVISNLLSNALKYSQKGTSIEIKCEVIDQTAQVSVKDEGVGIKQQDIGKLFERYYRVQDDQMQTISGFGIGLYLSAEIIERHNGKIWVESEPGIGSTFYFSLPLIK